MAVASIEYLPFENVIFIVLQTLSFYLIYHIFFIKESLKVPSLLKLDLLPELKYPDQSMWFRGHLGVSLGWASGLWLRSWAHGSRVWASHWAYCCHSVSSEPTWDPLSPSLYLSPACALSQKKNQTNKQTKTHTHTHAH